MNLKVNLFYGRLRHTMPYYRARSLSNGQDLRDFLNLIRDQGDGSISMERKTNYLEIKVSNPRKRNAISGRMMADLARIVDDVENNYAQDPAIVGILLTGCSEIFCAGADFNLLKDVLNTQAKGESMSVFMSETLSRLFNSKLVSVSLISGSALGGGAELCLATDYRIMTETSTIRFVQARLGLTPAWGGAQRLVSLIGRKESIRLLGTSTPVSAAEAVSIGLADDIATNFDHGYHLACNLVDSFAKQPYPNTVKAVKSLVSQISNATSYENARKIELEICRKQWATEDNLDALSRFK